MNGTVRHEVLARAGLPACETLANAEMPNTLLSRGRASPSLAPFRAGGLLGVQGAKLPAGGSGGKAPANLGCRGVPCQVHFAPAKWYNLLQSFDLLLFEQNFSLIVFGKFCDKSAI